MDRRAFLGILTGGVPALPVAIEAQRPQRPFSLRVASATEAFIVVSSGLMSFQRQRIVDFPATRRMPMAGES